MASRRPRPIGHRRLSVLVLVVSMIGSAMFVPGVAATSHAEPPPSDQVFEVDGNVSTWERAPFPLRAELANASWTVPNALLTLQDEEGNTRDLAKDPVGVYPNGSTVRLTFDDARASFDGGLDDREVTVVAARLSDRATVPDMTSVDGAVDLLTGPNVNDNASFEVVERTTLDDGTTTVTHEVDRSGQYLYFVATHADGHTGFSVDDAGDLSVDGDVTVIGVENVVVEETAASVSPPTRTVPAGGEATVNVDSNLEDADQVAHAFVLYDEETFIRQQFTVALEEEPGEGFDASEDVTVRSTVATVNGEGRVDTSVSVLGASVDDGRFSGTAGVGEIIAFLAGRLSTDAPASEITGETELDASAVVFEDGTDPSPFAISTMGNWSPGEYRWIYVAQDTDSTALTTDTGTVRVIERGGPLDGGDGGPSSQSASASEVSADAESVGGTDTEDDGDGGDQSTANADGDGESGESGGGDGGASSGDDAGDGEGASDGDDGTAGNGDEGEAGGGNAADRQNEASTTGPVQALGSSIGEGGLDVIAVLVALVGSLAGIAIYRRRT